MRLRPSGSTSLKPTASTPGIAATLRDDAVEIVVARPPRLVEGPRRVDAPRHRVLRLEPEIDLQQRAEAAEQQSRADQQHARERDLDDHQRVAGERRRATGAFADGSLLLRRRDRARGATPAARRRRRRPAPSSPIVTASAIGSTAAFCSSGTPNVWSRASALRRPDRQRNADERIRRTRGAGFRPAPAAIRWRRRGAEGDANGELLAARVDPRQQQVGEVDAGDREDAGDRARQHVERRAGSCRAARRSAA